MPDLAMPVRPSSASRDESGELESITITPSANGGYSVNVSRRPKPRTGKAKEMGCCYTPPVPYTFESFPGLEAFLRKTLGAGAGDGEDGGGDTD